MSQYIIKRLLIAIPTMIGTLTFIFFTMRILPGDPAVALLGEAATPEALADMRQMLGLDKPLIVQYATYLWGAIQGDFGRSIATNYPVSAYLRHRSDGSRSDGWGRRTGPSNWRQDRVW